VQRRAQFVGHPRHHPHGRRQHGILHVAAERFGRRHLSALFFQVDATVFKRLELGSMLHAGLNLGLRADHEYFCRV